VRHDLGAFKEPAMPVTEEQRDRVVQVVIKGEFVAHAVDPAKPGLTCCDRWFNEGDVARKRGENDRYLCLQCYPLR
jgi:hypothetical protein